MAQTKVVRPASKNTLHELGYKIFLDRYAQKDMTRKTLAVGDTVIVVVDAKTGQREIGTVTAMSLPKVTVQLLDGETVERDVENVDKPLETDPGQMMDRVAAGIAGAEKNAKLRKQWTERFRWLLDDFKFVPAGRILAAAGTDQLLTYYNCYVIPSPRDSRNGIIETLRQMTEIMSRGGGVGINISSLRPRHAYVKGVNGRSSGAVSWGALYSFVTGLIEQGGCFGPDERIATDQGLIPARELADRIDAGETFYAHTHKGERRITARFRNGIKPLYEMTTERGYKVRITEDHKVTVLMDGKITTMPLKYLQPGDEILLLLGNGTNADYVSMKPLDYERSIMSTRLNEDIRLPEVLDEDLAYLVGYMHGDGYVQIGKKVTWQAPKAIKLATADAYPDIRQALIDITRRVFNIEPVINDGDGAVKNVAIYSRLMIEWLIANGLLKAKAESIRVPEAIFRSPSSVQAAFIAGYFDADGCNRGRKGGYGIDSISRAMLEDVQMILAANGIVSQIGTTDRSAQGWQTIYRLTVTGAGFKRRFAAFVPTHKANNSNGVRDMYDTYPAQVWWSLGARSKYRQRIYDGVSARISVSQMEKIGTRLAADGQTATAQAIHDLLHTLPDKIASIQALGDSEVFDFEVDDVHLLSGNGVYTSNSRRGALMLILDDWHPDVFDFINSKREAGKITNANISVGVSDKLMAAIKADADWTLCFPDTTAPDYDEHWNGDLDAWQAAGRPTVPYKTVKARAIWNAIIESAWASAEPGVFFKERYNKMSNSHYYAPIISTNPCVTGDTLVYTDQGLRRMSELFDGEDDFSVTLDSRFGQTAAFAPSTRVFMTGTKPVFKLRTAEGYTVRATADHRFMTPQGWVELRDLKPKDKVHILNRKGGFGVEGSLELGRVLGWVIGDGVVKQEQVVLSFFGEEKRVLAGMFATYVNDLVHPLTQRVGRTYEIGVVDIGERDEARVSSTRLWKIADEHGLTEKKHRVPETVYKGSEAMQRGFLQALFTADGSFQDGGEKGATVRLAANDLELLEGVQKLLLNFGIASRIYRFRRQAGYRLMPDSNRELKSYWCEAQHELAVSKQNLVRFADEIGFLMPYKQDGLDDYITRGKRGTYRESFLATVETIEVDGIEDVYDLTEMLTHSMVVNGFVTHQCGEQGLPANGVCNLGAINLSKFYDADRHDVKWDDLDTAVRYATRFLDNVIDSTPYFFEENEKQQTGERRVGLNNMGLAELLIKLNIRYGSDESLAFIDKLYAFIARASYETSADLAAEKGAFPMFDADKFLQSGFMETMPDDIRARVRTKGIRNVTLLTQAPNGTTGTLVNTSTGIEPFFSWTYYRKSRLGLHEETVPLAQAWFDAHPGETTLPDYFVTAMDLAPEDHARVQGAIQRWVDSSISKCVTGETLVLTANGLVPIADLSELRTPDAFEPLAIDVISPMGTEKAAAFYYGGMRETRRLTMSYGYALEGTPNHQIQALDADGCIRFKRLDDIKIGDTIVLYAGQQIFGTAGQPLPGYQAEWVTNSKYIAFPPSMSVELAYVIGCITSEGSIHKNGVMVSNGDRALLEQLGEHFKSLFGLAYHIYPDKRRESLYTLQINSRHLRNWLLNEMGMMTGAANKTIPSAILRGSRDEIIAFLRGLFLDAYMTADGRMFGIGLATKALLKQLQTLLLNFGVLSRLNKSGPNAWSITVAGDSLEILASFIKFDEVWKTERISRRNQGRMVKRPNYAALMPASLTEAIDEMKTGSSHSLRSLYGQQVPDYQRTRIALNRHSSLSRQDAQTLYRHFNDAINTYARNFFAYDRETMVYVEVKAMEQGFAEVFDLNVPGSHSFIANGIGNHNTSNLPNSYTIEQTGEFYELLYDLGCKGGTVYRDGSRDEQVLMLKGDERAESEMAQMKKDDTPAASNGHSANGIAHSNGAHEVMTPHHVYPRPKKLTGVTVNVATPYGTAYVTMNSDEHGYPFEVFITAPGKAGSDLQADAEGLGRLISLQLRSIAPPNRMQMLRLIVDQLQGIGGARSIGLGPNRVTSLPDAVAGALMENYFPDDKMEQLALFNVTFPELATPTPAPAQLGRGNGASTNGGSHAVASNGVEVVTGYKTGADICPSCGTISLIRVEGCKKCTTCGYSEC
jgi:ribonucleotide reductase alpha subunit